MFTDELIATTIGVLNQAARCTDWAKLEPRLTVMLVMMLALMAGTVEEHRRLLLAGMLETLSSLLDCPLKSAGRVVGQMCAGGLAMLCGREESETAGLSSATIAALLRFFEKILKPDGTGVSSFYEVTRMIRNLVISDRHATMLLDAGVLSTLPAIMECRDLHMSQYSAAVGRLHAVELSETAAAVCLALVLIPAGRAALSASEGATAGAAGSGGCAVAAAAGTAGTFPAASSEGGGLGSAA